MQEQSTDAITAPRPAEPVVVPKMRVAWARYQYPGQRDDALAEVSFGVPAGGCVAVVGQPRCGKTTLLRLLRGQLEPTSGTIEFDGSDSWRLDPTVRHRIALVPTEGMLADASVGRNIALDRPGASRADIIAAAGACGASGFIDLLPQGYGTRLGAGGYRLTEGQRRRILLARALITRPEVLLLDEPTAGLRSRERHELIGELCRLVIGHTMVVATQDPLVIALADDVVRLGS